MENIFVTGGAGFIGQSLMRKLAGQVQTITIYDCFLEQVHAGSTSIPDLPPNVSVVTGDIRDQSLLAKSLQAANPDTIFHLAADTGTGQSHDEIARYCDVNVTGTAILIECLRTLTRAPEQVLLASSRAVYGEGAYLDQSGKPAKPILRDSSRMSQGDFTVRNSEGEILKHVPATSDIAAEPVSVYATTKLTQEHLICQGLSGTGTKCRILRLQNVYGPGQSLNNPYTGVLSIMSRQIIEGKTLNIFEDGEMLRDFVYVEDVVNAFKAAATIPSERSLCVDIGSGQPVRIVDAAGILLSALDAPIDRFKISGEFRPGDIRHASTDITTAKRLLAWQPAVLPETGILNLASWVQESF